MKKQLYISGFVLAALAITGCTKTKDFLQLKDRSGIDNRLWETEGGIKYFLNECYQTTIPEFTYQYTTNNYNIHLISDENYFSANDSWGKKVFNFNGFLIANDTRYVGAKYQNTTIGDNRYFDIGNMNIALAKIPASTGVPNDVKRKYLGQFHALRAMAYFGLTKIYGGMPLVLEPQSPGNINLSGRVKAKEMFAQIVKDLDSAIVMLDGITWAGDDFGRLSKAAAAALKAKALLYWASPQFNPVNDAAHPYAPERWAEAHKANKEAYEICIAANHSLLSDYSKIFQTEGKANPEAIIIRTYAANLAKRGHGVEQRCRPASEGGGPSDVYYPSMQMINAYGMKDGMPAKHPESLYRLHDTLFWLNRDPRFDATIAWNGSTWKLSGKNDRRQWTYVKAVSETGDRGLYVRRFSSPDLSATDSRYANDYGGSGMDWIELRFAEVILNYAETANETGDLGLAKQLVREIRKRAGIEEGNHDYGLGIATNKDQMRNLIANERMVEFAFEGKRPDDLRRTRTMHQLTGTITAMQIECASDAMRTFLETPNPNLGGRLNRDTLDINNTENLAKFFKPVKYILPANNGGFAMPQYYYFMGLSNAFITSSPLLEQTIGWEAGSFDPL